ncbi:hypothetical protein FDB29_08760 [Clostridium botulinum]|nr:hypothetical protein [Clostridium botulinum]
MDYNSFISKVIEQDKRNILHRCDRNINYNFPNVVLDFYKNIDIVDVEIVLKDLCSIKLYNLDEIGNIQEDYNVVNDSFVFATKEGDPIIIKNSGIYLGLHGITGVNETLIYKDFNDFIESILNDMRS